MVKDVRSTVSVHLSSTGPAGYVFYHAKCLDGVPSIEHRVTVDYLALPSQGAYGYSCGTSFTSN